MSEAKIVSDLREMLHNAEQRQAVLLAERDEFSYGALVERDPKAIKRLDAANAELSALASNVAAISAALKEAGRRQLAQEQAERSNRRAADAAKAEAIVAEGLRSSLRH